MTNELFESLQPYVPVIDDRSEEQLVQQASAVVAQVSGGALNDFTDSGPLGVLVRSQAHVGAELLYRVNKLPLALAVQFLSNAGVQRRLGTKAQASLTFSLTAALSTPFTIPAQFEVVAQGGSVSFYTNTALTIPPGATQGNVSATSQLPGSAYNVAPFTLTQITLPLAFLAGVVNVQAAAGGSDEESLDETIQRGVVGLRTRNPVSADDFRYLAEQSLGSGGRAKAIGLLGADAITRQPGAVHVFLLNALGVGANPAQVQTVATTLRAKIMLGTALYVSPMPTVNISVVVFGQINSLVTAVEATDALWQAFQTYLSPRAYEPGSALRISELRFRLRQVLGMDGIDFLTINAGSIDVPLPTAFTAPLAFSLLAKLTDTDGTVTELLRGSGESQEYVT